MLSVKENANQASNVQVCDEAALQRDEEDIGLWSVVPLPDCFLQDVGV